MSGRHQHPPFGQPVLPDRLLQGPCRDERLVDGEGDYVERLETDRRVDLRIGQERHLELDQRRPAKAGDAQVHVAGGESALFHTTFQGNTNDARLEDHPVDDGPRREGDLSEPQQFRPAMAGDDFGHADCATADLDTYASRNHQSAPDTEYELTTLPISQCILVPGFLDSGDPDESVRRRDWLEDDSHMHSAFNIGRLDSILSRVAGGH